MRTEEAVARQAAHENLQQELLAALQEAEKVIDILWVSHHANRADGALETIRAALAKAQQQ
ncbi:MAG: hypothetical protein ACREMA_16605 [Longimicrobiales bacterium]